ncbi:hypothetical protein HanPI659440_Chr17g0682861 [Helianthus annuus]|nr:hypothetical protein HanHA300_Chr17g0657331 [Helianthus annuus]KAJ0447731.1 hypothetical protein HanHA89_Chr17g0708661 [Helianthus annuus]KAJ0632629.1 hypothetical protein HanLR1_Chr17g0667271 [Helianthus annuus]KAJ0636582.1 hypothetical protein HanOQP8_Chr17g0663551 [Helianthus annuus]KAJ0667898.1 hypothetical protein HanPI659440_Chr17g0682861 [Helianthus annuus]
MTHTNSNSSILETFSLNPLPYPVLLILSLIFFFLGFQWYSSYEEAIEEAEESFNWVLLITPLLLLFAVKWLSSVENPEKFFGFGLSPWERRHRQAYYQLPTEGSSPWGVAALILLVLVLMQFRETVVEVILCYGLLYIELYELYFYA